MIEIDDYDHEEYVKDINFTSVLHDIGKMGIPRDILKKKGALTDEEIKIAHNHPKIGAAYIQKIIDSSNARHMIHYISTNPDLHLLKIIITYFIRHVFI